jgi:ABC-type Zn uptake system ZnuABC Zn-binding protein ZnuA
MPTAPARSNLRVVAVATFLADIAQNVAGDRVRIETLMPLGVDPHSFEPTPQDVKKIADSQILIVNGSGFEEFLENLLANSGTRTTVIDASRGLTSRTLKPGEPHDEDNPTDPHFWLDPTQVVKYVENIRAALTQADPDGAATYQANADAYISKLNALDTKIKQTVGAIPPNQRKLVTDHDTFGYYADRYGFEIVGMLVPSFSTADTSSAQQVATLIDQIRATGVKAIFLEQGTNPRLAEQISRETGANIVTGLYTHSLSAADGPAPTYLQMLEYDTQLIVDALK